MPTTVKPPRVDAARPVEAADPVDDTDDGSTEEIEDGVGEGAPERRTAPVRGVQGSGTAGIAVVCSGACGWRRPGRMTPSAEMWGPVRTAREDPAVRVPGGF